MADKNSMQRRRRMYEKLLRLYPQPFRERYAKGMVQTFSDLCNESSKNGENQFAVLVHVFLDTLMGIIKENANHMRAEYKNINRIALVTVCLLLIPLVAMQFTDQVNWNVADFAVAGILLFGFGLAYEFVARKSKNVTHRFAVGIAVFTALFLVWSNLAVGIIGSEDNPANLMYLAVLAVAIIGAAIARLQSHGMSNAMFTTALAQALVVVIAFVTGIYPSSGSATIASVNFNALFILLWIVSGLLFRHADNSKNTAKNTSVSLHQQSPGSK